MPCNEVQRNTVQCSAVLTATLTVKQMVATNCLAQKIMIELSSDRSVEWGVHSRECGLWSVECRAWSVESGVFSLRCGV